LEQTNQIIKLTKNKENKIMTTLFVVSGWMTAGITLGSIMMLIMVVGVICYRILAPRNIFFTFGRENRAMHVVKGRQGAGVFTGKIIFPSKTMGLNSKNDFIESPSGSGQKSFWGMYWIGLWPFYSIYERRQQWLEWKSNNQGKREIVSRDEMTPYLMSRPFEYTMLLEEGEDANKVPLNVYFTVILLATNGVTPIFGNENAYGQVQTLCRGEVLLFVKTKTFADLGGGNNTSNISHDEFAKELVKLNEKIPGRVDGIGLIEALGYKILDAKLDSVEITGDFKDDLLEASTAKYVAKEKAEAEIEKAKGEKQAKILRAEGDKIAGQLGIDVEKYSMEVRNAFYEQIKDKPFAQQIELAKKMFQDGKLTTFVSGKDVLPTINVKEEEK
jgi:hypothetical protein